MIFIEMFREIGSQGGGVQGGGEEGREGEREGNQLPLVCALTSN